VDDADRNDSGADAVRRCARTGDYGSFSLWRLQKGGQNSLQAQLAANLQSVDDTITCAECRWTRSRTQTCAAFACTTGPVLDGSSRSAPVKDDWLAALHAADWIIAAYLPSDARGWGAKLPAKRWERLAASHAEMR